MNILFFEIVPTGATSVNAPVGENPQFMITDHYAESSADVELGAHSHIQTFSYNEGTKELLVWAMNITSVPA